MFDFDSREKLPSWFNVNEALGRLNQWENILLEKIEIAKGNELTQIQQYLNRICFERERIKQIEKENS